ncbi:hypothetical protein JL722_13871 [Aureococcus anophagefferens]|nr:hypothetical protein JL722_13871 [Aureococcus anophagefferens]
MRPVSKPSRAFRPRLTPALATTTSTTEMIDAAESMVTSEETLRIGSLRFTRYDNASTGEPLLYVPGIEFRGISIAAQLPRLAANGFDPWYCWLDGDDRTPFEDVVTSIATFAKRNCATESSPGESPEAFPPDRDLLIRGLAHPVATNALSLFDAQSDATGPPDYWADSPRRDRGFGGAADGDTFFQTFGAVEVSPRNFVRLMRDDAAVLLFPGGVRESNHGKDEAYELFWPEETDFVRCGEIRRGHRPFGAVGAADSFTIVRDKDEPLPFGGGDDRGGAGAQPALGEPHRGLPVPARDACAAVYAEARDACRGSIDWLLEKREGDAYENPLLRLPYEAASGAAAPTFEV